MLADCLLVIVAYVSFHNEKRKENQFFFACGYAESTLLIYIQPFYHENCHAYNQKRIGIYLLIRAILIFNARPTNSSSIGVYSFI